MNLVEQLIRIDTKKASERETKQIVSSRLSKLMGEETKITITELSGKRLNDLAQIILDKNGNKNMSKVYDMNLMYCVNGIVDPSMKDERLMEHFGAKTPKDLVEILFQAEAGKIAGEIAALTGATPEAEEEVKNS